MISIFLTIAIDYILVGKEKNVRNIKTIPGEVMMQHCLVVMDILYKKVQKGKVVEVEV